MILKKQLSMHFTRALNSCACTAHLTRSPLVDSERIEAIMPEEENEIGFRLDALKRWDC